MKRISFRRYRSGSSSDSAINFENAFEEEEEKLTRESCNLYDDFFLMMFNFITFAMKNHPKSSKSVEVKRMIELAKKYVNFSEKIENEDKFGFIVGKSNTEANDEQVYLSQVISELLDLRSNRYWCCHCESIKCSIREYAIPNAMRPQIWMTLIRTKIDDSIDAVGILKKAEGFEPTNAIEELILRQIELDITRTMPNHKLFASNEGISKLRQILISYCIHINPDIGYCQGMNFIAALLLVVFGGCQINALLGFVCIIDHYFPPQYYDHHLTGARADQMILQDLITTKLLFNDKKSPTTITLEEITSALTLNWFLSLFHGAIPWQIRLHVLDCFWIEGVKAVFRFSLALLKLGLANCCFETQSTGELINTIRDTIKNYYDIFELKRIAFSEIKLPKRKYLASQRSFYAKRILNKIIQSPGTAERCDQWPSSCKNKKPASSQQANENLEQICRVVVSNDNSRVALCRQSDYFGTTNCEITIIDTESNENLSFKSKFIKNAFLTGISNDGKRIIFCQNSIKTFKKYKDDILIEVIGLKYTACQAFFKEKSESVIAISKEGIASKIWKDKINESIMLLNDKSYQVISSFLENNETRDIIWVDAKSKRQSTHQVLSFDSRTLDILKIIMVECENIYQISTSKENDINIFLAVNKELFQDKKNRLEVIKDDESKIQLFDFNYEEIIDLQCFNQFCNNKSEMLLTSNSNGDVIVVIVTKSGFVYTIHNNCNAYKKLPYSVSTAKIIGLKQEKTTFCVTLAVPSLHSIVHIQL